MPSNSDDDNRNGTDNRAGDHTRASPTQAQLSKRALLATVGHELRTPLHAVTGMLDLLWNTSLDAEQRSFLADARQNTAALVRTVGDALDYATLAAGEMSLAPEPTSIRSIVDAAARLHAPLADARGLELIVDVDTAIPERVLIDSARVQQVLSHLIERALAASASGHVLVQVYLNASENEAPKASAGDDAYMLSVNVLDSPTSRSMAPADPRPPLPSTSGTGHPDLSLALCMELVKRMHGRLDVYPQPGGGTCTTCLVPAVVPSDGLAPAEGNGARAEHRISADHRAGFELVVYDEHPCTRQALSAMARFFGVDVVTASDPNDLLDLVSLPTLGGQRAILLGNGHSVAGTRRSLQQIRALRNSRDMPAAIAAPPSIAASVKADLAVPVALSKPVSFADLHAALMTLSRTVKAQHDPALATGYGQDALHGRVLVVDDMVNNLKIAQSMLRRMGMTVETCTSGRDAIRIVEERDFDLIFMDIQMPGMDGHETTAALRRLATRSAHAPVIALTANSASEDLRSARQSGMDDFVVKPARAIRLREVVSRWLRAADALRSFPADAPVLIDKEASEVAALISRQRELEKLAGDADFEQLAVMAADLRSAANASGASALARLAELTAEACHFADFESAERYVSAMRRLEHPHDCPAACD